ncbi:MAG: hypothetical protein J6Q15_00975, partial [Clostridia bacterium]|nr:hypothetical protein [Clostridia bacterium]
STNWTDYYTYDAVNEKYNKLTDASAPIFEEDKYYSLIRFEKYEDGLYIQYVDDNTTPSNIDDDQIVATAIVYYIEGANNTYNLVSEGTQKGLIEKTVLPNIDGVDGTYSVGIVSGSSIATLTGSSTITFSGVGKVELKFVSVLDRTKSDTVVIFVENPLHEDVFNINSSAGLENNGLDNTRYTTRVGVNSILSLSLKGVGGQVFDSTKTYMTASYSGGTALATIEEVEGDPTTLDTERISIADVSSYFSLNAITEQIATGKYILGQFNVVTSELKSNYSYLEIPVTINVYLNLDEYYIDGVKLSTLLNSDALLATRTISIIIYNKATALSVSSNVKAEAGEDVDVVAQLTTGYVNENVHSGYIAINDDNIVGAQGNKVLLDIVGQDAIEISLTAVNDNAKDLLQQAKSNSANPTKFSVWNLFDAIVSYKLFDNKLGYTYSINLKLKDNYRYLNLEGYTDREWLFKVNITASSNTTLSKDVTIAFVPQELISLRLENYSNLVASAGSDNATTVAEFVSSQTESSLIIPGASGLVKIYADYTYSYFENVTITSSRQTIDGNEYFIRYQQMVYNQDKNVYESYAGITADGETLNLKKVSYKKDGQYIYDGVLFVRTILDEFVGVRKTFTMTVNATTYDLDGKTITISRYKSVISQYRPGVYIGVENAISTTTKVDGVDTQVYLVEENSSVSTIVARVYGYEFNIQPIINVTDVHDNLLPIDTVSVVQQGAITTDDTGAYLIRYTLAVNTLNPFKVSMKMTLIDNGNTLTNTTRELLFYPVEY